MRMKNMTTKPSLSFTDYSMLIESLNLDIGEVKNDPELELIARSMLPKTISSTVSATYNKHMADNNLRLIKFQNEDGHIEYHIRNTKMMLAFKSDNVSKLGFMSVVKMIHHDALSELAKGNTIRFQSLKDSPQHAKYKSIIERIAKTAGKTVKHVGLKPITSAPFLRGETMLIENVSSGNTEN